VQKLSNIQILRAVAAMMVVIYHCGMEMSEIGHATGRTLFFDHDPWGTGVALFFAISGFIMVSTSYDAFGRPGASLDFARRRIIRIVPVYWLMTTVAVAGAVALPHLQKVPVLDAAYITASYLFWPVARANGFVRPIATPGWTLNLEMMFYAVFAVALLFPRRFGLGFALAALGGLTIAQALGTFAADGALPSVALNFWGDPIITGFLFGMLAGVVARRGLRMSGPVALGVMALGFALLLHTRFTGFVDDHPIVRLADSLPSALIVLAAAIGPQVDGRRLVWAAPLFIGDASYSLYLVHEFGLRPLRGVWLRFAEAMPLWTFLMPGIALSLALGALGYLLFERPVTRWLNGRGRPAPVRLDRLGTRLRPSASA